MINSSQGFMMNSVPNVFSRSCNIFKKPKSIVVGNDCFGGASSNPENVKDISINEDINEENNEN